MTVTNRLQCEPLPSSIRSARLFVVDKLQEWRCDDLVDRAALLTSELATNSVVHTGMPYSVHIERRGLTVRVNVIDLDEELPTRRDDVDLEHPSAEHAFSGLGILAATATAWGSQSIPGEGKVVWFELTADGSGAEPGVDPTGLHDLRESAPWSSPTGELDDQLDDWLVAMGGPRLNRALREALVVLGVAILVVVGLLVRG